MALNNLGLGINLIVKGNAQEGFKKIGDEFGKFSGMLPGGIGRVGGLISKFGPLALKIGIVVGAFKVLHKTISEGIKVMADWEQGFAEVTTLVSGVAEQHLPALEGEIGKLSIEFGKAADDMLRSSYQAISAGINVKEAGSFMGVAGKLAVGGVTDMETAVDGLTSIKNAFGKDIGEMTDVSDKMFIAMKAGKTTIAELSRAIGQVAPISANLGISLGETLSMTAALTKGGLTTSEAVTGIRQAMVAVMRQQPKFLKAAKKYGFETDLNVIKTMGMTKWIDETSKKLKAGGGKWSDVIRSVQGLTAMLTLSGKGMKDNKEILEAMNNSAGASEEAFKKMSGTYKFALGQMDAQKNEFSKAVGIIFLPMAKSWVKTKTWIFKQLTAFTVWFKKNFTDQIWINIQPVWRLLRMVLGGAILFVIGKVKILAKVFAFVLRVASIPIRVLGRLINKLLDGVEFAAEAFRDAWFKAAIQLQVIFFRVFDRILVKVFDVVASIIEAMAPIFAIAERTGIVARGTTEITHGKITDLREQVADRIRARGGLTLGEEMAAAVKEGMEARDDERRKKGLDQTNITLENEVNIGGKKIVDSMTEFEKEFLVRNFEPVR